MAYKHWVNGAEAGSVVFAATTVLDFVPVFADPVRAELMTDIIFGACAMYGARLHAFVVMPEHMHMLIQLPPDMDARSFFNRLKVYSGRELAKTLGWKEKGLFSQQIGLNRRTFWQRSFRSRPMDEAWRFRVALRYIHRNPVKRGLVARPEDWRWSSAWMHNIGEWDGETGVRLGIWWEDKRAIAADIASTLERAEA